MGFHPTYDTIKDDYIVLVQLSIFWLLAKAACNPWLFATFSNTICIEAVKLRKKTRQFSIAQKAQITTDQKNILAEVTVIQFYYT